MEVEEGRRIRERGVEGLVRGPRKAVVATSKLNKKCECLHNMVFKAFIGVRRF